MPTPKQAGLHPFSLRVDTASPGGKISEYAAPFRSNWLNRPLPGISSLPFDASRGEMCASPHDRVIDLNIRQVHTMV